VASGFRQPLDERLGKTAASRQQDRETHLETAGFLTMRFAGSRAGFPDDQSGY